MRWEPAVTSDDIAALTDQDWIGEAERSDASGDLGDLRFTMGPRIARIAATIKRLEIDRRPRTVPIGGVQRFGERRAFGE
jgi:hypothetical protein